MSIGVMDIFKHLPASKKLEGSNCKACGYATCMAFALKLSKKECKYDICPVFPDDLKEKIDYSNKVQQQTVMLDSIKIGGETVLYRHEKTFNNPTTLAIKLEYDDNNFQEKFENILNYEIECVGKSYKVDAVYSNSINDEDKKRLEQVGISVFSDDFLNKLHEVKYTCLNDTLEELTFVRKKAIIDRDENYSKPTFIKLLGSDFINLNVVASAILCKYSNMIIFEEFSKELMSSLITLRMNIFTDPQKPLQVESKVYEFNSPDENANVFLTTNFALSFFAVANELSSMQNGSYLVITPSDGMSVLTAWSAQKITAEIASRVVSASDTLDKVKKRRIIIPGLLCDLKEELEQALVDWEIVVGTNEAYKLPEFVKNLNS